jgi:hypothetical protein
MAAGTAEWIVGRMRAADVTGVSQRYAPNVLLDVQTPSGRVQLQGRSSAAVLLAELVDALTNMRVSWVRPTVTAEVVVVEYELRWDAPGGECVSRAVSVYRLAGDAIVEHVDYSCGAWTSEDIQRIMSEAPIVRW